MSRHLPSHLRRISLVICCLLLCFSIPAFADDSERVPDYSSEEVSVTPIRIGPSDTSGFHSVVLGLIGDYNPIAVTTAYQYPSGTGYTTRYQVDVEPDWSWICTCALFTIVVFCVFRLVGGIFICKR